MEKIIDLQKTVFELYQEHPDILHVMKEAGFDSITKPGMLQTAGRVMTIPKGARMRGIELQEMIALFEHNGYTVKGE